MYISVAKASTYQNIFLNMFIYTEFYIESHRTLKTLILQNTPKTIDSVSETQFSKYIFSKNAHSENRICMLISMAHLCYVITIIIVWGRSPDHFYLLKRKTNADGRTNGRSDNGTDGGTGSVTD